MCEATPDNICISHVTFYKSTIYVARDDPVYAHLLVFFLLFSFLFCCTCSQDRWFILLTQVKSSFIVFCSFVTGGVEEDIRKDVWSFLFELYPWNSTTRYACKLALCDYTWLYLYNVLQWCIGNLQILCAYEGL